MKRILLCFLLVGLSSCLMLDLKTRDDSSEFSAISFNMKWPDGVTAQDSVHIAMNAVSEPVRYMYDTDSKGNVYMDKVDTVVALYGNYVFLACTCDEESVSLEGPSAFLSSGNVSLRDFKARVHTLENESLSDLRPEGVKDFNSNTPFLAQPKALCYDLQKFQVSDTDENSYSFNLHSLVQNITVNVKIKAEDGVTLTEVVGEITGLPSSVSLFTGAVSQTDLGRVIFRMIPSQGAEYNASFSSLGLFPSESSALYSGPGILRLRVSAYWNGVTKNLYPAINLRELILSSGMMTPVQNGEGYKIALDRVILDIPATLVVGKGYFAAGDGSEGVDAWFDSEKTIDVEV